MSHIDVSHVTEYGAFHASNIVNDLGTCPRVYHASCPCGWSAPRPVFNEMSAREAWLAHVAVAALG